MANKCKYGCINGRVFLEATRSLLDCPDCRSIVKQLEQTENAVEILRIPDYYKNVIGIKTKELFTSDLIKRYNPTSVRNLINVLDSIVELIYNNKPLNQSYYIFASSVVDINMFVYSTMLMAKGEKGLSVTPYISVNELHGLHKIYDFPIDSNLAVDEILKTNKITPDLIAAVEGMDTFKRLGCTYQDYINADICFLEATACTLDRGWETLQDLLSNRARRNKATVVFGFWSSYTYESTGILRFLTQSQNRLLGLTPIDISKDLKAVRNA